MSALYGKIPIFTTSASCPVLQDARRVLEASRDFSMTISRLHRSRRKCRSCEQGPLCPAWVEFNRQVEQAIREINREWELS